MVEWISVNERLPSNRERLGYVFDGTNIRHDAFFYNNEFYFTTVLDYDVKVDVTHWMSLPEPPDIMYCSECKNESVACVCI